MHAVMIQQLGDDLGVVLHNQVARKVCESDRIARTFLVFDQGYDSNLELVLAL